MKMRQTIAVLFAALLVVGAAAPATVAAAEHEEPEIEITQSPETGNATVVVTQNGTAVENATLVVENDAYAGAGTYETDANGSVELPNPDEEVEVELTAVVDGEATSESATLVPRSESLDVEAEQTDDGAVLVTVTQYDAAVEGADVVVDDGDDNATLYAGEGAYVTDANGTVTLPVPANETTVTVTATSGDRSAETSLDLEVPEPAGLEVEAEETDDGGAVVTVTDNDTAVEGATVVVEADGNYTDEGTFETDANGTVTLAPAGENDTVTLEVVATYDNETATTSITLGEEDEEMPFGQRVADFVQDLLGDEDREGGIGQTVSEWVREHNPGKAKGPGDNAGGPPTEAGNETSGESDDGERPGNGNGNAGNGNAGDNPGNGNGNAGNALIDLPVIRF